MLEEPINSSEESIIVYFQQLVGDYSLVLALIAIILLIIVVLVILLIVRQAENEVNRKAIRVELKQINVASNGILVEVDALIRNVGETTVTLSEIYLHLIEINQTHIIEVEEVFGADLPYEIGVQREWDIYMNFVTDRPLMEDLETEGWIVCHTGDQDFPSNRIECIL